LLFFLLVSKNELIVFIIFTELTLYRDQKGALKIAEEEKKAALAEQMLVEYEAKIADLEAERRRLKEKNAELINICEMEERRRYVLRCFVLSLLPLILSE
jgi:hypothetical protein